MPIETIIVFSLLIIVTQFVLMVVLFLKIKKLRAEVHDKVFEILMKDNLITGDEHKILTRSDK